MSNDQEFINRLNQHPKLRTRMEELLNVVENTAGDCTRADDAEQYVIEQLRQMGSETLHAWADRAVESSVESAWAERPDLEKNGKKNSIGTAHTEPSQPLNPSYVAPESK